MTSTPVGTTGNFKLRQTRYHLPANEMTYGDNRIKTPVFGSRHGKDSRPFHSRKDVDIVKPYNINNRHPKSIAKLERIPTSACHDSRSNCRSLCTETTNQPTRMFNVHTGCNAHSHVRHGICNVNRSVCNPRLKIKTYQAGL